MGCVYVARNTLNDKLYVGWTVGSVKSRSAKHIRLSKSGSDTAFHRALRKYGPSKFDWQSVFESDDRNKLKLKEMSLIASLGTMVPSGYNMTQGGDGLICCTAETRQKMSKSSRGRKMPVRTAEYRAKLSKARRSLLHGPDGAEFRKKLSVAKRRSFDGPEGDSIRHKIGSGNRGKKMSDAQKQKLKEARKRFLESPEGVAYRKNLSERYKGRKLTKETKLKMSIARTKRSKP